MSLISPPGRLLVPALLLALAACGDADAPAPEPDAPVEAPDTASTPDAVGPQSVASLLTESPRLTTLARLADAADLASTLADTASTVTVFAPSDAAFAALGDGAVEALEADPERARRVLLAHVVPTRMLTIDVFPDLSIETTAGTEIAFAEAGEGLAVRSGGVTARITDADLDAENGVVHVIDAVLGDV